MATKTSKPTKPSSRTVVLNLQKVRAERSATAPVIVGPDGVEYPIGGIPLDSFLAILELQQAMASGDSGNLATMLPQVKALVGELLPGFPAGDLTLDELMLVINVIQAGTGPEPTGDGSDDEPGE
ncbi:MAG: hypothetical protein KDE23_13490 [Caldilinea sp.]|nr:hypothetical protein [Caldilinea sp.]